MARGFRRQSVRQGAATRTRSLGNVDQGILGRIFNFGTIIVNGTGGSKTPIPNIDSPLEFRRKAMEVLRSAAFRQAVMKSVSRLLRKLR